MSRRMFPPRWIVLLLAVALPLAGCDAAPDTTDGDADTSREQRTDARDVDDASLAGDDQKRAETDEGARAEGEDIGDSDAAADDAAGDEGAEAEAGEDGDDTMASTGQVATVNGQPLALAEFQRQAFDTQRYFVERGLDPNTEEGQAELLALRRNVLRDMIHQALIEQAAEEMNLRASDEEVAESLAAYEDALDESLDSTDLTREEAEAMERKAIVGRKFVEQVSEDVASTAPHYRARHILCAPDARAQCEAALTRLEAGEDFAAVARELSMDETTAEAGGDLDWVPRVEGVTVLPSPELEEAIFALEPGERSPIVQSAYGFHIVQVDEVDEDRELSDEQRFQLRQRRVQEWLAARTQQSDIVIYAEDLQDAIASR